MPALIKALAFSDKQRHKQGKFRCVCGGEFTARISDVWYGRVTSCGCWRRKEASK